MTIHADHPVRVVELLLTPAWSEHNQATMEGDATYQAMQRAMRQPVMIRRHALDARLRQIAWSVLNPPAHGAFTNVHLDASAMSLLSILAEAFRPAEVVPTGTSMRMPRLSIRSPALPPVSPSARASSNRISSVPSARAPANIFWNGDC
jgi:hypothetical protein